jgi:hypothetical protein
MYPTEVETALFFSFLFFHYVLLCFIFSIAQEQNLISGR